MFRTSSKSWNTGACTEVGWRTSTRSNSQGACTEVASAGVIMIRDSMDRGGFVLQVRPDTWTEFLSRVRRAEPFPA